MGEVYRAVDTTLGRQVAIKFIDPTLLKDKRAVKRFHMEASILAKLDHPNIVPILDIFPSEEGESREGIVMPLVEGRTLKDELKRPIARQQKLKLLLHIARGLEYIHRKRVLHLDLKPGNVMLEERWGARILDFGLARCLEDEDATWAEGGHIYGTPGYMSPEQYNARQSLDARSDLFTLGILAYEVLTGTHPFPPSSRVERKGLVCNGQQIPLIERRLDPPIPQPLSDLVEQLLKKLPEERPMDAAAVVAVLENLPSGERSESLLPRYLERLRAIHQEFPVGGFDTRVPRPLLIDDVYISLEAQIQPMTIEVWELEEQRQEKEVIPLDEALRRALQLEQRGAIVLGEPGSGKTTLLKHYVLMVTDPERGPKSLGLSPETIPVLITLRDLNDPVAGLKSAIREAMDRTAINLDAQALTSELLEHQPLLLLVDGLDEVADIETRRVVVLWLQESFNQLPQSLFVITSRTAGYRGDIFFDDRLLELRIRDLDEDTARRFIHAWFRALETRPGLPSPRKVRKKKAEDKAERLCGHLFNHRDKRSGGLRQLATNPLLLQSLCLVFWRTRALPERRVELYQECVEGLVKLWHLDKGMDLKLKVDEVLRLLQPLAWALHTRGAKEGPWEDFLPALERPLRTLKCKPTQSEALLQVILDQTGVLLSPRKGVYAFLHLSFQEYLCARHLQDRFVREPELLKNVAHRFGDLWWREVLLLALGLSNPSLFEELAEQILKAGLLHRDVELANDCLQDASEPSSIPILKLLAAPRCPEYISSDSEDRFHALGLLQKLFQWEEETLPDGRSGRGIVEFVARHDPEPKVRHKAAELLELGVQGEYFHRKDGSTLVYCPGGEFTLGADDWRPESGPAHTVHLSPFWIGKYPVTNSQYRRFLEQNPHQQETKFWRDRTLNKDDHPVVGVSWEEARAYCRWAHLALPSEAQWEAAARGQDGRYYPWGNADPNDLLANYERREGGTTQIDKYLQSIGPYGTFDQAGNVWEWCLDSWDPRAHEKREGMTDPVTTEGERNHRSVRGGSWLFRAAALASAARYSFAFTTRNPDIGFRCIAPMKLINQNHSGG